MANGCLADKSHLEIPKGGLNNSWLICVWQMEGLCCDSMKEWGRRDLLSWKRVHARNPETKAEKSSLRKAALWMVIEKAECTKVLGSIRCMKHELDFEHPHSQPHPDVKICCMLSRGERSVGCKTPSFLHIVTAQSFHLSHTDES